jgi:ERCC4-related helicase
MADLSTFTTAMTTPENSIKNLELHKDLLKLTKMINGLQLKITNGFLRKMRKWNNISKKNLEVAKSIQKNSSFKTIEKCLNSLRDSKEHLSLFTIS